MNKQNFYNKLKVNLKKEELSKNDIKFKQDLVNSNRNLFFLLSTMEAIYLKEKFGPETSSSHKERTLGIYDPLKSMDKKNPKELCEQIANQLIIFEASFDSFNSDWKDYSLPTDMNSDALQQFLLECSNVKVLQKYIENLDNILNNTKGK